MLKRSSRLTIFAIIFAVLCSTLFPAATLAQQSNKADQSNWEKIFLAVPSPDSARRHLRYYTEEPHMAGSERDYQTAVYTRDRLREYGISAEIKEYQIWLPFPKEQVVEMTAPTKYRATLHEEGVAEDKDSFDKQATPLFNAYSANGDVTGQLVFVNYGLLDDYKKLAEMGINVKGKVVIARYGKSFRGVKAKIAEERGAVGLIIYSDPADDGYMAGDTYPRGPYRPATSAQRGSILYTFQYPGDPLTPGVASTKDAQRIAVSEAQSLPKIPVQPMSYQDASPLLEALSGQNVPRAWQGGLPFTYHLGPGPAEVHMKLNCDFQQRTIWNVIGEIKGKVEPEKWVILGNHRDAWVYGAADPNSGSSALLEVGRGLGELLKKGWQPDRTIILGSWDAEEFGLIGSTEWVEEHRTQLSKNAIAYINVDVATTGPNVSVSGVPSLMTFVHGVLSDVIDPNTNKSLLEAWAQKRGVTSPAKPGNEDLQLGSLGSGSDFTPFLQHVGVPSIDLGFYGSYGVYHSIFDSFHWMEKFGDPNFTYHATVARVWGLMAMRLATSPLLPFDYSNYGAQMKKFIEDIDKEAKNAKMDLDLTALRQAAENFYQASKKYQQKLQNGDNKALRADNDRLLAVERALIDNNGLPGREWYKHIVYAPGYYAGYDAEVFSGLKQAIDERDMARARTGAQQIETALKRATEVLF